MKNIELGREVQPVGKTKEKRRPEQFVVDEKGRKTAVILGIKEYEQLMEDRHDLAVVAERRNEDEISFEEMRRRLLISG